jgi:hypothetical protein
MEYPLITWIARQRPARLHHPAKRTHGWSARACAEDDSSRPANAAPELFVIFIQIFS